MIVVGWLCAFAGLTFPVHAGAVVTVGPDVNQSPLVAYGCNASSGSHTLSNVGAFGVSPMDGVVVRWRVHDGSTPPMITPAFRVVRASGATTFTGAGSTGMVAPFSGVAEFGARVPLRAGDRIGIEMPCSASTQFVGMIPGDNVDVWTPGLVDGESPGRAQTAISGSYSILANADIEADTDHDGFGDETQDACPAKATTHGVCLVTGPSIAGKTEVGRTLAANGGATQGGGTASFQWLHGNGTSFTPIAGATGTIYDLVAADRGKQIKVTETVSGPGSSDSATAGPSGVVGPPLVSSSAKKSQRAVRQRGVVVTGKSNLDGTLTATGTIALPNGIAKTLRFRRVTRSLAAGKSRKLTLRLSKKGYATLKRVLVGKRKLRAKLVLTVKDKLGGKTSKKLTITLKR